MVFGYFTLHAAAMDRRLTSVAEMQTRLGDLLHIRIGAVTGHARYFLLTGLKSELAPVEDRGVLFTAGNAPEGSTIDFTSRYAEQFDIPQFKVKLREFVAAQWQRLGIGSLGDAIVYCLIQRQSHNVYGVVQ